MEISEALAQLPEGASYSVWKYEEPSGEKAWCMDGAVADFDPAVIGTLHGGGRYIVYFRKPDDKGRKVPAGAKRLQVAKSVRPAAALPAAAAPGNGFDVQKLFATIAETAVSQAKQTIDSATMLQGLQAAVLKTALESRAPVVDPIAQFSAMMAAMAPLLRRESAEALGPDFWFRLMDRERRDTDPAAQLSKMMELVAQAREMYGGDGEGAPPWVGMVEKGLGLVQTIMDRAPRAIAPRRTPAGATAEPDNAATSAREETVPAAAQPADPFLQAIAPYVPQLVQHAERGHDPDTYAGVILDGVEPGYHPQLATWLTQPNLEALLVQTWPDVGRFPEWFDELLGCMRERLAPEEEANASSS